MGIEGELPNADLQEHARIRTVHVTCPHDCPDACSMRVSVDSATGRAIKVEGDPSHPITRGYLCNKVNNYLDYVYNPNRVLYPRNAVREFLDSQVRERSTAAARSAL